MTNKDKQLKLKSILNELGISRKEIAAITGLEYSSVAQSLSPSRKFPNWLNLTLVIYDRIKTDQTNDSNKQLLMDLTKLLRLNAKLR